MSGVWTDRCFLRHILELFFPPKGNLPSFYGGIRSIRYQKAKNKLLYRNEWSELAKTTFDAHTDPIFRNLGILKFHDIYLIQLGLFMYSYQNRTLPLKFHCKFTLQSQVHSYGTRNSCKFRLPFCSTRTKQFSVFYQGPKFYNTLNTIIMNASSPFPLKEHLRHLFVIIISILQQKSWEKAF